MKWEQDAQSHRVRLLPGWLSGRQQPLNKAGPYPQKRRFPIFRTFGVAFPNPLDYDAKMTTPFALDESCIADASNCV